MPEGIRSEKPGQFDALLREGAVRERSARVLDILREVAKFSPYQEDYAVGMIIPSKKPGISNLKPVYGEVTEGTTLREVAVVVVERGETMEIDERRVTLGEYLSTHRILPQDPNEIYAGVEVAHDSLRRMHASGVSRTGGRYATDERRTPKAFNARVFILVPGINKTGETRILNAGRDKVIS